MHDDPRISEETKKRVRAVVRRLGYLRNDTARNLRIGRGAGAIGLVIGNLANPFYSQLALGVGDVAEEQPYRDAGQYRGQAQREVRSVNDLLSRRVEGIVIAPEGDDQSHLGPGPLRGTPVVCVARPPAGIDADCVLVDDYNGTRQATALLIDRGHTRIGFIGLPTSLWTGAERLRGFKAAMRRAGLRVNPKYVRNHESDVAAAEKTVRAMLALPEPPTALFAANNRNMIGALRAVGSADHPVALAGFDDFELADMLDLPLIVVSYDAMDLGRQAAKLLLERVEGKAGLPACRLTVPTTVVQYGPDSGKYHLFGRNDELVRAQRS